MKTEKVTIKKLQIVFGVAYHAGEREVPPGVAVELRRRKALIETPSLAKTPDITPVTK